MSSLQFDAVKHEYRYGEEIIPSVTKILKETGIIQYGIPGTELVSSPAMERGKAVHLATAYLDQNVLNWKSVVDELYGYLLAYEKFKTDTGFKPIRIEERLYHPLYRYAGTLDREGTAPGKKRWLIDIKTGEVQPWTALQLAGYDLMLPELKNPRERFALQLIEDGQYRLIHFQEPGDRDIFLALVNIFYWRLRHGYARPNQP